MLHDLYRHDGEKMMSESSLNDKKREKLKQLNFESNKMTKECIQTALLSLMAAEMFEQITVTAIIKRAGVSRGGFYRNYASKEEVLKDIAEGLFEYLLEFVSEYKVHENPKEWFCDFFQIIYDHKDAYKLLIDAKVPSAFSFQFDIDKLLRELQKDDSRLEHYRALAMANALAEVALSWFKNGMQESSEEMSEIMYQIFFRNNYEKIVSPVK